MKNNHAKMLKTKGLMAYVKLLLASLLLLLLIWGCEKETYVLTLRVSPEAGGIAEEGGKYESGKNVMLMATAHAGFHFAVWAEGDDFVGLESDFTYSMPPRDVILTAHFFVPGSGVTDIDGNTYPTVHIGQQEWMAGNLKTTRFNDGTPIHIETDNTAWIVLNTPAMCWFNNDEAGHKATYGALYNWFVTDAESNGDKEVCPVEWRVPTDEEWSVLLRFLDPNSNPNDLQESLVAGGMLKQAGTAFWDAPNRAGLNTTGFTAVPGGYRGTGGTFVQKGADSWFWSSTGHEIYGSAWYRSMQAATPRVARHHLGRGHGFSIRCLKD